MGIYKALNLNPKNREIVSVVGSGGKTTTIFALAKELKPLGKRVLITTSTKIYEPKKDYNYYFLENFPKDFKPIGGSITILGERVEGGKLIGPSLEKLDKIIENKLFDFTLIEADGSKQKPIKAMGEREPVVPRHTTKTIGIIGINSLDEEIQNIVHRPELFIKIVGKNLNEKIVEEDIVKLVLDSKGLFKNAQGKKVFLLNKVEEDKLLRAKKIREGLLKENFQGNIILGNIKENKFY